MTGRDNGNLLGSDSLKTSTDIEPAVESMNFDIHSLHLALVGFLAGKFDVFKKSSKVLQENICKRPWQYNCIVRFASPGFKKTNAMSTMPLQGAAENSNEKIYPHMCLRNGGTFLLNFLQELRMATSSLQLTASRTLEPMRCLSLPVFKDSKKTTKRAHN